MIRHKKCDTLRIGVAHFKRNEILVIALVLFMLLINLEIHFYIPEIMRKYLNVWYYALEKDDNDTQSVKNEMLYPYFNNSDMWVKAIEYHTDHFSISPQNHYNEKFLLCRANAGFGNRINHIVSCFALAMILNRALVFDWKSEVYEYFVGTGEITGMDSFDEIFQHPKHVKLMNEMPSTIELCKTSHTTFKDDWQHCDHKCFLGLLKKLKSLSKNKCIEKTFEYDYWGISLFSHHFKKLFENFTQNPFLWQADPQSGYSYIARFLFQPKFVFPELEKLKGKPCEWFIQRRTRWSRDSVPMLDMIKCARKNGMKSWNDMQVLSDDPQDQHFKNQPLPNCRGMIRCDAKTIHVMYILSQCKNAVISQLSTFGLCIVSLGNMQNTWLAATNHTVEGGKDIEPLAQKKMKKC